MFIPKMKERDDSREEVNLNPDETVVESANITQVKTDLGGHENEEESAGNLSWSQSFWSGATELYRRASLPADESSHTHKDEVMSSRSIFVGTLVHCNEDSADASRE